MFNCHFNAVFNKSVIRYFQFKSWFISTTTAPESLKTGTIGIKTYQKDDLNPCV